MQKMQCRRFLTHARTRYIIIACPRCIASGFAIMAFACHFLHCTMFQQAMQPALCGVGVDARLRSMFQQFRTTEGGRHAVEETVAVGVGTAVYLRWRQEGKDVCGMDVERFHKSDYGFEVGRREVDVPTGNDAVFQVVGGQFGIGGEVSPQ